MSYQVSALILEYITYQAGEKGILAGFCWVKELEREFLLAVGVRRTISNRLLGAISQPDYWHSCLPGIREGP